MKRDDLAEWSRLESQRRDLSRQLATLRSRQTQLEEMFSHALEKSGKTSIKKFGYTLALAPGRASVSWSNEYQKLAGVEAAQRLKDAAAANATTILVITPPEPIEAASE
jgi:hypothetical protein